MKSNTRPLWFLTIVALTLLMASSQESPAASQATGEQLYTANCAKCHGREGEGFLRLNPPLHNSRFLKEDVAELPCIIRNGLRGKIVVGTTTFNQIMPAIRTLSATQISHMITFMQKKWDHPQTELTVSKWLEGCNSN